jgi:hypothetical protein
MLVSEANSRNTANVHRHRKQRPTVSSHQRGASCAHGKTYPCCYQRKPGSVQEQQARSMIFRTWDLLVRQRTQLVNALRGHLAEHGISPPTACLM